MKHFALSAGVLFLMAASLVGCKVKDSYSSTYTVTVPATMTSYNGKYTAWADQGGIIYLTNESVAAMKEKDATFEDLKRVTICFKYDYTDITQTDEGEIVIYNAELIAFAPISTDKVYMTETTDEAEKQIVKDATNPDSIHMISQVVDKYAYLGYYNIDFTAESASETPNATLVCDSMKENNVYVRLLFNNHNVTDKTKQKYGFFYSFDMAELKKVPGYDSVTINLGVYTNNLNPVYTQQKISRADMNNHLFY